MPWDRAVPSPSYHSQRLRAKKPPSIHTTTAVGAAANAGFTSGVCGGPASAGAASASAATAPAASRAKLLTGAL